MHLSNQRQFQQGFTLVELIIAMAIIALLARIAIPAYMESVNRGKRAQAQVAVTGLAQSFERYFSNCNSYNSSTCVLGASINASNAPTIYPPSVPATGTAFYTLTVNIPAGGASYTISATPVAGGSMANDKCGTFTLASDGTKNITGQAAGVAITDCWK